MAYVITAVGAGGKTTYLKTRAQEFLRHGRKTALTTTTHIWPFCPEDPGRAAACGLDGVDPALRCFRTRDPAGHVLDCFGIPDASGKLSAPGREDYDRICRAYDVVLVEGDGSHCMPVKIPGADEPVIPYNTDEIAVIMGAHAVGRRLDVVCQRYEGESRETVTADMLEAIARREYIVPLRARFPRPKIFYVCSQMPRVQEKTACVLMASGFGRRYGGNKLLEPVRGKLLYRHALDHVITAVGKEQTVVVTQYDAIIAQVRALGIDAVKNDQAAEGIAASIRLGTQWALERDADVILFFAADMPDLPAEEIRMFAGQFSGSGKKYGCMEFGKEHISTNPGAFRLKESAEKLLQLSGDRGAMRIMKQEPWNIYYYQIPPEYAADVDVNPLRSERSQTSSHQTDLLSRS